MEVILTKWEPELLFLCSSTIVLIDYFEDNMNAGWYLFKSPDFHMIGTLKLIFPKIPWIYSVHADMNESWRHGVRIRK